MEELTAVDRLTVEELAEEGGATSFPKALAVLKPCKPHGENRVFKKKKTPTTLEILREIFRKEIPPRIFNIPGQIGKNWTSKRRKIIRASAFTPVFAKNETLNETLAA